MFWRILAMLVLFSSEIALSTGELEVKQGYKHFKPSSYSVGLNVHEPLWWKFYTNAWIGGGADNVSGNNPWLMYDNSMDLELWKITIGLGGSYIHHPNLHEHESEMYVHFAAKLW